MDDKAELDDYKNFYFSESECIKHPLIAKLQENKRLEEIQVLDEDVMNWLVTQDKDTKQHINDIIRHAMALTEKMKGVVV